MMTRRGTPLGCRAEFLPPIDTSSRFHIGKHLLNALQVHSGMRWAENVARVGEIRDVYSILIGKTEGKMTTRKI
jgi:hypothetical protein